MRNILVTDTGFTAYQETKAFLMDATMRPEALLDDIAAYALIIINFDTPADGRGFSLARRLRELGFTGQILAKGALICDQYRHARQSGFDGMILTKTQAIKMPEQHWQEQAATVPISYRERLFGGQQTAMQISGAGAMNAARQAHHAA